MITRHSYVLGMSKAQAGLLAQLQIIGLANQTGSSGLEITTTIFVV